MTRVMRIAGRATAFGALGLIFFLFLDTAMWVLPPNRGWGPWKWESSGAVAIGDGYSVVLHTRTAHPWLAEYDQRLELFAGSRRDGRRLGVVDLNMNTGGRTDVRLYFGHVNKRPIVQLSDRFGDQAIDVLAQELVQGSSESPDRRFIGTFSEESYPLKFVPAQVDLPTR